MDRFRLCSRTHRLITMTRLVKRDVSSCVCCIPVIAVLALVTYSLHAPSVSAQGRGKKWVTSWAASPQGPYPIGAAVAQPVLSFALPNGATEGAVEQTFRLIVKPDLWGSIVRLRFSNNFGNQPVTLGSVKVGLQDYAGNIVSDTNGAVTFGGKSSVTLPVGEEVYSDPVTLRFASDVENLVDRLPGGTTEPGLHGRKLAISIYVQGKSGLLTWHAKGMTTSYITPQGSGDHSEDADDAAYPFSTTSWYFLDAVDVVADNDTAVVCAFGDSITDGTNTTLNGDDRWPNDLSRRLHEAYGNKVSVVNEGIGGNTVINPISTGPAAVDRLDRDVLGLAGLTSVVWLEGINDLGAGHAVNDIIAGYQNIVNRLHTAGIKVIGCTLTSALLNTGADGGPIVDANRKLLNAFIRTPGAFDGIADFDAATLDPATGGMRPEFVPNSTVGGAGDNLHPNRAGYQAMANTIDLSLLAPFRSFPH
jgi:lysophospholipase L1-like esterase